MYSNITITTLLLFPLFISSPYYVVAISGGYSVQSSEQYPFSVTLTNPILCGGSIITLDPPWILTAAHCIEDFNINDEDTPSVAYGNMNFSRQSYASIKRAILHPLYISSSQQLPDVVPYDIGLIELTKPLVANIYVNRVRLYIDGDNNDATEKKITNNTLETIGMGYTGLKQPHANLLQYALCTSSNTTLLRNNNFNNSIILTTSDAGLCHGDSGSPLLYKARDKSGATDYYMAGVLNRILNAYDPDPENTSCPLKESNMTNFLNLFVKPSSHINWITQVTNLSKSALIAAVVPSNSTIFSSSSSISSAYSLIQHSNSRITDMVTVAVVISFILTI